MLSIKWKEERATATIALSARELDSQVVADGVDFSVGPLILGIILGCALKLVVNLDVELYLWLSARRTLTF